MVEVLIGILQVIALNQERGLLFSSFLSKTHARLIEVASDSRLEEQEKFKLIWFLTPAARLFRKVKLAV